MSQPSQPSGTGHSTHSTQTTHSSLSTASPEAQQQPPFPQPEINPEARSPKPQHPNAEALLNAAAQHVFPESERTKMPPSKESGDPAADEKAEVTEEGRHHSREDHEAREEEPIIGGTPLDEMTPMESPGGGGTGFPFGRQQSYKAKGKQREGESRLMESTIPENEATIREPSGEEKEFSVKAVRPGMGPSKEIGSVRMGASALMSALNALPWEDEEGGSSDSSEDEEDTLPQQSQSRPATSRPKVSRMHSSLHTIRPDPIDTSAEPTQSSPTTPRRTHHSALHFPFRDNTIARKAQSPSVNEMEYQLAFRRPNEEEQSELAKDGKPAILAEVIQPDESRRSSVASSRGSDGSMPPDARIALNDQITKEEDRAGKEEVAEIAQAAGLPASSGENLDLEETPSDFNTDAALREGGARDEEIEDRMSMGKSGERQRMRKEKLGEKLMQVFGLAEREEVLEEMRCWLLRSVMLKGYMYLTAKHICFFAHMPDKANVVIKSGPLSKKASRTKLMTKYWAVLKNDVMSWYESTADPYFPKGSLSLQYVSSCDAIDGLRFKVRTPERNYTFSADTESARDEWVKAIEKVMFKTQHEGENVKLVIPLEAVLEIEKSPTLEFAETIEIRCVDGDDHMSVDSYFFASFSNTERTIRTMQKLIDARPPSLLPRRDSGYSDDEEGEELRRQKSRSDKTILGKVGSVLKPLLGKHDDSTSTLVHEDKEERKGGSILGLKLPRKSHDSEETLHAEESSTAVESDYDGYPPRQTGPPPSREGEKGWSSWIKKPVAKVLHPTTSRSGASVKSSSTRVPLARHKSPQPSTRSMGKTPSIAPFTGTGYSVRLAPGESERVTEIVEPNIDDSDSNASEDDDDYTSTRNSRRGRQSFSSERSGLGKSEYAMLDGSKEGREEEGETARKFRSVFSLSDKEELIDHFPGYLYRVLPVSGRFFVSTNYFCFRSSQLLYKTKMMIPIRDLYGLKAQKAFRFNHSGLIIVIKGHEEVFLEFSSDKRREACVRILEQRMEAVRVHDPSESAANTAGAHNVENRIMEDLDESAPLDTRSPPPSSPSGMFASTTSTFLEFKPEPMRVTCLTIGSRGDVQPYIALCKGLQAEGHHTKIATHGEYKDWVEGHGIEFASVGGDPAELMQMCVDNGMFTVSFMREGLSKFRGWLDDLLMSSWEACQDSDLLIESPSAMGGVHIAEALQIPYFRAFTMPWTRTRAYPHAFAVPEHKKGGAYNYMTYTMFDQVFWKAISGQVNRWRRKVMGIEPTTFDKLEQHKIPFLYNFSPSVVPPPLDWTEWTHVTGYWFLENADESAAKNKKWSPPEDLTKFMETAKSKGKKIVYIGFGSIVVSDPQEMTRCVIDSVLEADVYAILSKGWSDRGSKAKGEEEGEDKEGADGVKYPDQIYSIDSIDHSWLFTRIDAACHHGGAGTTGASLRAGIPTIIKPFFGDQAFWSERVESLNVGSAVRKLTVEALSEALKKATTDEKQIAKAKVVGETIRKENGVSRAIESIYRDLEYAKSQIRPLATKDENGIPLGKVSSIFSGHSKDTSSITSGLSNLGLSRTDSPKQRDKARPSSFSTASSLRAGAHGDRSDDIAEDDENESGSGSKLQSRTRDTSAEGEKEQGSDGSWSVVSGEGRSGASSPVKNGQPGQGFALAPALA